DDGNQTDEFRYGADLEATCDDSNQLDKGYNSNVVPTTEQKKPNECEEQTPAHQECHQARNDVCLHSVGVCGRNLRQLQATENKVLRMAIDAPWFVRNSKIYRDLEWEPLRDFLQRKAASTFEKAENHPFVELRNAVDYAPEDAGPRKKRPRHQMAQQGNRKSSSLQAL
ncbi:hypothetical protein YQE_00536, partial [Dendroctonus ponderosae]